MTLTKGQHCRHEKSGRIYVIINPNVTNSTNGELNGQKMVSYHRLYEETVYVREHGEFLEKFKPLDLGKLQEVAATLHQQVTLAREAFLNGTVLPEDCMDAIVLLAQELHTLNSEAKN